ncbi:PBECR2 nuclease fold domain-containing protein [Campylobacter upsaliensis]
MQFNFNFEAFEQSGKEKNEAINYLKSLNSSIDFDKLEQETKGDENAIYEALKGGNFSFSKPSIEQTRQKLLKNKENEALKAEFNAGLSWLGEEKKQNFNFYDFKKAKEKANSKQGLIQADLKEKERQMQKKEALFETRLKERGIIAKSFDDMLDQSGAYLGADLLEKGLNKLGFKDENYIFESEKEDIKSRALKSVREKLERGDLEFNEREKHALRSKYDEPDYKKALEKEKERLRLSQKSGNFSEAEREFIENDLGFFNTLFNDDKENIKEFKEKVKSEGVISSEIIKAANTLKAFDEGNLFKNMLFADEKEKKEFQQNFLNDAYKIAELSGFDDVGLDKKGELYFIKDEQKYLVNTGFFDNFAQLLNDTKFEFAGGVLGGLKGFNSGKSAKGKVAKSILGAAAGSFGGAFLDAKIADMYLNRESDFKKNLDFAIQAGLLSMAGDGVILSVKPLAKGLYKGVKKGGEILGEYSILGTLKTLPQQNIQAAEKIIDEVFSPKMKEELKAAQEEFGGSVRGEDLKNAFFANLQKKFTQKYGENDSKTKSVAKIAEIFNTNSLKTRQQAMLDLVRSDTHGSTLAYLLEIAKDDVKIQSNLKNMLNLASSNVEKNLKNLNINAREIKHILDEFEAGNKAAFKEVESQISKLYDENYRVVLSKGEYENIKEEFRQNGVNLEEMTPFLRDLEANVFNENGVTFTQLNNFRKNLNFYIFNKDKTPNFINTLKKIGENILKNEIDKGIDNIFSQNKAAYESIKELYSTSLKDYATLKSLNESIKNLKLQDSAKSADEVLNSLIKYAKGQGEKGVNNLQKIKDYLGEENNAFLEMQILNKLFKESVVENDRASLRVFDSESFLGRVRELVGDTPAPLGANLEARALSGASQGPSKQENFIKKALNKDEAKLFLENLNGAKIPKKLDIEGFLKELESVENKENFISHLSKKEDAQSRLAYLNLVEPTLKEADLILRNGKRQDYIKKFNDGKDFFTLLITEENGKRLITFLPKTREDFIKNKIDNASLIQSFTSRASKQGNGLANESITQPLFKSKEAREFLELVEGFHKLYKNDAGIAKNLAQGTASQLSTSIATSAEGAIKQKVVKGGFDPIFRLLPDGILFGLFSKQIQGGALRYHLKKALSRSLNYDDFKIKLEKELKRTNFNSNTSRLIDEFMQNLEDFNREKEQFLEAKRIEQTRIKEEEQARINTIKTAQENAYNAQEANLGNDILEPSSLKEDFGENFAGYKGKEAIEKLLEEQRGQVKGAFYKEGLGEIDLVWGEVKGSGKEAKGYGLSKIIEKHGEDFKEFGEGLEGVSKGLDEIITKGEIHTQEYGRKTIIYHKNGDVYKVGLKQNWKGEPTKNSWVITGYKEDREADKFIHSSDFTKGEALPLNSNESIAQKALNLHEKLYLKDNDTPLNVEYKIVNKDDIKPSFTLSKTQFRSQKQEDLIKKIKENFNPDLLVNIRGDLKKGNPIITKEGEVISGNHRAAALKELEGENLAKYQNAVKEAFGVELKENEMLVRVADTSEAEIRRFSAASNEGLENNLGEQGVSLFAKYQDKIKALKEAKKPFVADDVYNLKYLVNKALGESSITKENDTSKALFASLAKGRNNTILKALNELEKENLEQVSKVANMFFDNAGAFYNLTHDLDLPKMQNLQNYFSDVLVSAAKADFTRAEDFARLNEDIRAFLDSGDKNAMLKLSPNLVSDLLAKAMGAGFARFARLENPSASLYEFLNGLKKDLLEKGAPDLFSGGKGIKLNERDEFDFAKELILKGQDSEEKFRLYQNLEELKAWKSKSSLNQPTKESLDKDLNKSYTLELENLEPVSLNANALSKETEALTQSVESGHKQSTTIAKTDEQSIARNAKSEKAEFESFKDKIKELYTKYEGLSPYDKSASQLKSKLLNGEIKPEIKKEFKSIIDKFKGADNKDKMLRVIKENKEELSDYLAFNIALRKDIYIDGYGVGKVDFYDKSIRDFIKFRENKQWSEIDESKYRALAALENLRNKNTALHFSFRDLNGKSEGFKTYPRKQDLLFDDLTLGDDFKSAMLLSTKDKQLKEKLNEKLKAYIDKKIYADFLEYKIKDLESRNPKNSHFENYKDEKWDEEALKSLQKELEDLRANETQKAWLEAFNLKSLDEAYIPNFKAEVKEAINRVLGGEEIKLTKGSLIKLIKEKRLKYLDRIKPTLENPHSVILQNDGALIFARDYGEEKYFTSVARNDSGEWIIRSNAPKSKNGLNNKILNGGKEIYNDQAASQINASNPYDDIANSNIKLDNESIAQNSHYLELVKEYGEENAKRIIKQKILSENIAQVLENEEEKFIYKKGDREFEFKIKDAMGQFEMQYDELNLKSDLNKSFLKALNKLKIGYEVLENEPVRIRYFKQEAKERKPKETKPSANKTLGQIQKDMSARLKELKAQAKENYERYKNEDKALQKELTNTKDLFKAFEKEFNETEGTILISRAKRRKNDAEGKVETSVFLGNELALRNALDRWERYSGYSEENALEVKERLELLRSYVKRLEKHREDIKAKREQLEQDYQQNEAARSKEMGVIGNYNILSNLKGVSENELYEPFLEKIHGFLSKADFYERHLPFAREEFQKLFNLTPLKEFGTNYAEFYKDGKGAVEKLLAEKQGQVAGAFYKEGLGEIDLVWGEAGSGKSDGFGLAKIVKYHPEVIDKLDDIIANTSIVKESDNRYHLENENYKLAIRKDFEGEKTNWLLTAFEKKDSIARRRTDLPSTQSEAEKTTSANANEIIPQEIEQAEIKKLLEEYGEQISSNYPQETARLILEQNKNDGIVLSGFKIKGKSYDPEIEAMQFKTKKAEREFESLMESYDIKGDFLNFKEAYSFKPNDEAFLQYLAKYEGDENAKLALAYNLAKQLVMRRGGGRAEVYMTDFLRQMHILENQNSTTLHSNPHLGAGLVGGVLNGVEQDENGNLSFDPVKFAMGFLGGAAGSKAVKESIKWRANKVKKAYPNIAKNNPTLMQEIAKRDLLTYAKNETQNALTRLLNKNKLFDSTKGLFAGEKALLNEAYAPHKARLEKAKELEGSGADEIEIWEKTGWYKDKDHKWKFEISQRGGELDLAKIKDKDSEAKLGEILKDDELFKAYPQLRDMSVKHVDLSGNYGFYYVPYNDIKLVRPHIQLDIDEIKTSPYKVKEVLYHEIQHAIQHKEQFAYGLSYMAETYERYLKQHGEVEARNIQERMKNPTKIHPHKTMDTDIEDTIAESALSTEYSEAFSRKLEKSFLDESGRIAYKSLMQNAEKLPKELNLRAFKEQFKGQKYAIIKTPIKDVKINTDYAFYHLLKSGNGKENRKYISGGILATLQNPLFVTKDERGSYYFYKPFKINENLINLVSVEVDKNDKLLYKTSYEASKNKLKSMIEKYDLIYFAGGIQPVRAE